VVISSLTLHLNEFLANIMKSLGNVNYYFPPLVASDPSIRHNYSEFEVNSTKIEASDDRIPKGYQKSDRIQV
jgi:hypothetical protein